MLPNPAFKHNGDGSAVYSVFTSQLGLLAPFPCVAVPNFTYRLRGQLGARVLFPARSCFRVGAGSVSIASRPQFRIQTRSKRIAMCVSSLLNTILHVVIGRTKKQVYGITAGRVIAVVANKLLRWVYAIVQKVGYAVASQMHSLKLYLSNNDAVTVRCAAAGKAPTLVNRLLVNLCPKAGGLFCGKRRDGNMRFSQVSLLNRLMRLGSFGRSDLSFEPFLFYHAERVLCLQR